jgi:hypothetical protein
MSAARLGLDGRGDTAYRWGMLGGAFLEAHPVATGLFVAAVVAAAALYVIRRIRGGGAAVLLLWAALATPGCKTDGGTPEVARLADAPFTIGVGQTVRIYAVLTRPANELGAVVSIEVDNGGIVSTDSSSSVPSLGEAAAIDLTGVAPGATMLRVYLDPSCADPAAACGVTAPVQVVGVEDPPAAIDSVLPEPAAVNVGDTLRMVVTLRIVPSTTDALVTVAPGAEGTGAVLLAPEEGGTCGSPAATPATVRVATGVRAGGFCVTGDVAGGVTLNATLGDSVFSVPITVQ